MGPGTSDSGLNPAAGSGEVLRGAWVPPSKTGDRRRHPIPARGGARGPVYETFVRLSRGGVTAAVPMGALISNPAESIYVQAGDVLTLVRLPQSFTVFGATGANTQVNFTAQRMTLVEALAQSGG